VTEKNYFDRKSVKKNFVSVIVTDRSQALAQLLIFCPNSPVPSPFDVVSLLPLFFFARLASSSPSFHTHLPHLASPSFFLKAASQLLGVIA